MKLPISWLNEYVDLTGIGVPELKDKFVGAGFEIDGIEDQRDAIKGVYTAKITLIEKHPGADKLDVCKALCRSRTKDELREYTVVTGAKNVKAGDIVPLALDGAVLPGGKKIGDTLFREILSEGMFCGGGELNLTEANCVGASFDGVLIFSKDTPVGADINDVLGFDDIVLDIAVTPNRPDCNSVIGLAKEAAAILRRPFKRGNYEYSGIKDSLDRYVSVEVKDDELCPRYMAGYVKDITLRESPFYIKKRLRSVGIKSINNIVDITNYVLTEIGQPMHAFDSKLIRGGKIVVRRAGENEEITTLDGKLNCLKSNMLVIADARGPMAVAGIMGGLDSGINDGTRDIVFESARFSRGSVRTTSRTLNLKSDSSARYEKGIDFYSQELAIKRAFSLICELKAGTVVTGVFDSLKQAPKPTVIKTKVKKINDILGIKVPADIISSILNSLEIETTIAKNGALTAVAPPYREDIATANDLSEEVARLYGYDKIVPALLDGARQTRGGKSAFQKAEDKLKSLLTGLGFNEIITFSFINGKAFDQLRLASSDPLRLSIRLLNPLSEDLAVMRTTLTHSMLSTAAYNLNKGMGIEGLRFFESAAVYLPGELPLKELPNESKRLALCVSGEGEDFFTLKGVIEVLLDVFCAEAEYKVSKEPYLHPGRSAEITVDGVTVGNFGELRPETAKNYGVKDKRVYVAELDIDDILKSSREFRKFKAVSKYPSAPRDIAVVVDEAAEAGRVLKIIKKHAGKLLERADIFDVFRGSQIPEGKKSLAISLNFQAYDRTLGDAEVKLVMDNVIDGLKADIGGELR